MAPLVQWFGSTSLCSPSQFLLYAYSPLAHLIWFVASHSKSLLVVSFVKTLYELEADRLICEMVSNKSSNTRDKTTNVLRDFLGRALANFSENYQSALLTNLVP